LTVIPTDRDAQSHTTLTMPLRASEVPDGLPPGVETRQLFGLLVRIAAIEFSVEVLIMMTFSGWNLTKDVVVWGLLDATLLTLCAAPLIYVFAARPYSVVAHDARERLARELDLSAAQAKSLEDGLQKLRIALARNEELQRTLHLANLQVAETNERVLQKIGADLHDGPAQLLAYALLRIRALIATLAGADNIKGANVVEQLRSAIADSLREVRNISTGLSPPGLESATLREAIVLAIALHEQHTSTSVHSHILTSSEPISEQLKVCVYRVVQEALTNAYRHAGAKGIVVKAICNDRLQLTISDAGPGFIPELAVKSGLGLNGMRARVESLGGRFRIDSTPGAGARIFAEFDLTALEEMGGEHG
jgi:signal transduction histidine kinase